MPRLCPGGPHLELLRVGTGQPPAVLFRDPGDGPFRLSYLLMSFLHTIIFELFLLFILLCLIVIYAVSMAQVLWAQLALGVLLILRPPFIPFILVEPLAFLFWGWFKSMFTYTLYGAIAAALMRVFLAASIGWMDAIVSGPPPNTNFLWHSTAFGA